MVFMLPVGLSPSVSKESSQDRSRSGHFGGSTLQTELGTRLGTSHIAQMKQVTDSFADD